MATSLQILELGVQPPNLTDLDASDSLHVVETAIEAAPAADEELEADVKPESSNGSVDCAELVARIRNGSLSGREMRSTALILVNLIDTSFIDASI